MRYAQTTHGDLCTPAQQCTSTLGHWARIWSSRATASGSRSAMRAISSLFRLSWTGTLCTCVAWEANGMSLVQLTIPVNRGLIASTHEPRYSPGTISTAGLSPYALRTLAAFIHYLDILSSASTRSALRNLDGLPPFSLTMVRNTGTV